MATADNDNDSELSPTDELILMALLSGDTYAVAAANCNVSKSTVARRAIDPVFRGRLDAIRREMAEATKERVLYGYSLSIDTLVGILQDPESADPAKVSAARTLIEHSAGHRVLVEHVELADPVALRAEAERTLAEIAARSGLAEVASQN